MAESNPNDLAVLDGEVMPAAEARIPATDDGLLRGDGVFEALRVYNGVPFGLEEHLQRIVKSADGIMLELDIAQLSREVDQLIEARGPDNYQMRIVVTRGGHRLALSEPLPDFADSISLGFVEYRTTVILDGLKTLSYGANMHANRLAKSRGFSEALLVTPEGVVLEAPTASIFWSPEGETLVTPPLGESILASITRQTLLDNIEVVERPTTREELLTAKEAFLCASIREVQAINRIEDVELPAPGPLTATAQAAYRRAVEARLAPTGANIS
jgi:branched-subunit amino acid aminotransferase/4-amino-4-deoxychorismate lyase